MDDRLRKLERKFKTGNATPDEVLYLRSMLKTRDGYCPSWFVVKHIQHIVNNFFDLQKSDHTHTFLELNKLMTSVELTPAAAEQVETLLQQRKQFYLNVSFNQNTKVLDEDPLIAVSILCEVSYNCPRVLHDEWNSKRLNSLDYLRSVIGAFFEQCGYHSCFESEITIIGSSIPLSITGFPFHPKKEVSDQFKADFRETYQRQADRQFSGFIKYAHKINTKELQVENEYIVDREYIDEEQTIEGYSVSWVPPGSLKAWLQDQDIEEGYLVLAETSRRIFLDQSVDSDAARSEFNKIDERYPDIRPACEMIFIFTEGENSAVINGYTIDAVPTAVSYFKDCIYFRLIAEV